MMKYLYLLILTVSMTSSSHAQNFIFTTDQHIADTMSVEYVSYFIGFTTPDPEEITYKFEKISGSMPLKWDFSLCDYQNCYIGIPDDGTMKNITEEESKNGVSGFFTLSGTHNNLPGEGSITLYVYDAKDYSRGDTVSWHLTYNPSVSTDGMASLQAVKLYPNPASERLNVAFEGDFEAVIYNNLGARVSSFSVSDRGFIDVSGYSRGTYTIALHNLAGLKTYKQFIVR